MKALRMTRSPSLAAYMAFARRAPQPTYASGTARPEGELVWAHAADGARAAALCQLGQRLAQLRPGLHLLLTVARPDDWSEQAGATILPATLPAEKIGPVNGFLDHWRPDLCLWSGGPLRPALLSEADARAIPLYLVDASERQFDRRARRWLFDPSRAVLRRFAQVQARNSRAARLLGRMGLQEADITVTGPLRSEALPVPYDEVERDTLARTLLGRPVWLAAHLHPDELDTVLEARRRISRLSHRLILVVCPETREMVPAVADRLAAQGLRVAHWSDGEVPSEGCQVILGDPERELGLWFRLAPVCFMGHSLMAGMTGRDPNLPAVHGCAILYGPGVRGHLLEYGRYAEARAAHLVRDAETIAAAVSRAIVPDEAAAMAHAAWDVASQAAEANDRLIDLVQDTLDLAGRA